MFVDAAVVLGVAALVVSIVALFASAALTARQIRLLRDANHIPAVIGLISELRQTSLHNDYYYVTEQLQLEHDPQLGISGLPEPAKTTVINVAYYFNSFAFLVAFGLLDERRLFLTGMRHRIVAVWQALEPYALTERSRHHFPALVMLEMLSQLAEASARDGARFKPEHRLLRMVRTISLAPHRVPQDPLDNSNA